METQCSGLGEVVAEGPGRHWPGHCVAMRRNAQPRSITPILVIIGIAAIGAGLYYELPGLGVAWLCLLIAGVMHPAPPPPKRSEMDDPGVIEAQKRHRMHREAAAGAFGAALLPGWTPRYSWFFCLAIACATFHLPTSDVNTEHLAFEVDGWGQLVNAAAAFLIVSALNYARSKAGHDEPHPGTRIGDAIIVFKSRPHAVIAPGVLGIIVGFILAPWVVENYTGWPLAAVAPALAFMGALAGTFPVARHEAVTHWKRVVDARNDWRDRFEQLKITPAPTLVDVELIESNGQIITTHHFKAPAGLEVEKLLSNQADKIVGSLDGAAEAALAPVEQKDSQGQPRPGTIDRRSFDVVELPMADQMPQLTDPKLDDKVVETVIRAMLAQVSSSEKARVLPMGHEKITTDESDTAAYAIEFTGMDGVSLGGVLPIFSEVFGAEVAVDHRAGKIYLGGLGQADFSPASGVTHEHLERLARETWWKKRWSDAFKKDNQDPRPEWVTEAQGELAGGTVVRTLAFVLRNGFTPEGDFFPKEAQMRTALDGLPFFSMTGFLNPGGRPGERHPQAVVCRWAENPVPQNPADIAPVRGSQAPSWVLASIVNEMFTANKLARPELAKATALSRGGKKHLWHLTIRLYGGVTLAEIRKKARAMRESVAAEFFRVAESDDGVELIIGANPSELELSSRAKRLLASLEWEQAFIDAKMDGLGGSMPKLIESTEGKRNKAITTLRFDLAGTGFNLEAFTSRKNKLMATSGKSFIMPQPVKDDPTKIELVVADRDPFPRIAPIDYQALDGPGSAIPLATDVFGDYVSYDPRNSPHLMVIGTSGGGKSVLLQTLIYGFLVKGAEVFIADPGKQGADFEFAREYAYTLTGDLFETAGMLRYVYAEVDRRKRLNAEHGVGKFSDLPEPPKRMLVVLDEFTSLVSLEKIQAKAPTHPEAAAAHEEKVASNDARAIIGDLVGRITKEARSVGVTVILAGQKLDSDTLSNVPGGSSLRTNMARLLVGKATYGEKAAALRDAAGAPDLGDDVPAGRGIYESVTAPGVAAQFWFDSEEQNALGRELSQRLTQVNPVNLADHTHRPDEGPTVQKIEDEEATPVPVDIDEIDLSEMEWDDEDD